MHASHHSFVMSSSAGSCVMHDGAQVLTAAAAVVVAVPRRAPCARVNISTALQLITHVRGSSGPEHLTAPNTAWHPWQPPNSVPCGSTLAGRAASRCQ